MSLTIAHYVSSHGYGHAARQQPIIAELAARGAHVHARTAAPAKFFKKAASHHVERYDIGVVQQDALTPDIEASLKWYGDYLQQQDAVIAREVAFCREAGVQLVLCDVAPIAMEVAQQLGVPSVVITHFTWDWVYEHYLDDFPQYAWVVEACRKSYNKATLALEMPFAHPFPMFNTVEKIPLVVNRPTQTREAIRASLGIPADAKMGLLSMGGHNIGTTNLAALKAMEDWVFLIPPGAWEQVSDTPQRFRKIPMEYDNFHDLIAASDVMVGKAGGSTVSQVIADRVPMVYTMLPNWREAGLLDDALREYGVGQFVEAAAFQEGAWVDEIRPLIARDQQWKPIDLNGAKIAAERVLQMV